eukprot:TRINITY_DN23691_c0_g1_i1.p1 TRINITY_DN23691_c0_g1~~TRINITY_DN23691_c0_g1_i1.p1  ORF type:complete len:151 (+),score=9.59 TRINITY_DN23691_c0_g1_i1:43-495(+)
MEQKPWVPHRRCGSYAQCTVVKVFMIVGIVVMFYTIARLLMLRFGVRRDIAKLLLPVTSIDSGALDTPLIVQEPTAPDGPPSSRGDQPPSRNPQFESHYLVAAPTAPLVPVQYPPSHNPHYVRRLPGVREAPVRHIPGATGIRGHTQFII